MVTFPDEVHPKYGLKVRFAYAPRAQQYLDWFNITTGYPSYTYLPLNLTFDSSDELYQFLLKKGIIYHEVEINVFTSRKEEKTFTVVDTLKIHDLEESISKYLLNYKYYSINEIAEMLSFSRPTIYKIIKEGKLKTIRINRQMRIKHGDLTEYINNENQV